MPQGFVGYNQASDVGNAFGGVGDILGSAILRGAMMRQAQQDRQQQLLLEIERLKMERENATNLDKYRNEEINLRKDEGKRQDTELGFKKQKADEGAAEDAMRKRFATAARTEGLPPKKYGMEGPTIRAADELQERQRLGDVNEGMAFLSNDPSKAMEGIARQAALRSVGSNPVINELLATGMNLHNAPPGNQVMSPGGTLVGEQVPFRPPNPARPQAGQDLSANTALTEYVKLLGNQPSYESRTNNPVIMALEPIVRQALARGVGTNAPPAQPQGQVQPITAVNPQTKQRIVSYDGGQTWQPAQ